MPSLKLIPILALLVAWMTSCNKVPQEVTPPSSVIAQPGAKAIHVGVDTWLGYGPGYIAKEKGFFGDLDVDLIIMDDWGVRQNAFISGKTQMDATTIDTFAISSAQNMKGSLFMMIDTSNGADGIVAKPEIKSAADLKGKKVAYTRASCSHFLLIRYLQQAGLTMNDIDRVEVDDPGRAGDALVAGSVDAAVTWEPMITQIVKSGKGQILITSKTFPNQIVDVLTVNPDLLEHRKEDLQKFVNGWLKAVEFIKTNPSDAYAIMAKNFKIDPKEVPAMAEGVAFADLPTSKEWFLPAGNSKAIQLFDQATQAWLDDKLISNPQSGKDMFITEFIENAK
jgi:NitT/TauT family transport system substrate-binding protein